MENKKTFKVVPPPPIIFLVLLLAAFIAQRLFPFDLIFQNRIFRLIFTGILLMGPGRLAVRTFLAMRKNRTTLGYSQPTAKPIVDGPFGFTKNTLNLASLLLMGGICNFCKFDVVPCGAPAALFDPEFRGCTTRRKYLENSFGEEYVQYKKRVSRWIGFDLKARIRELGL